MAENVTITVEEKLKNLFELQKIDSSIDKIKILRGELPLQVNDLEDEITGFETRKQKAVEEVKHLEGIILEKKNEIKESEAAIKRYEAQQEAVRNNREFDSLNKEIEFQNLEIQLSKKRIKEFTVKLSEKKEILAEVNDVIKEKNFDLSQKKNELNDIVNETQKEEKDLIDHSKQLSSIIEPRLLNAYNRIRLNVKNGLGVVMVERDSCGGCFNKIPPQRQLDIATRKKVIVCEYCGRILVDPLIEQ